MEIKDLKHMTPVCLKNLNVLIGYLEENTYIGSMEEGLHSGDTSICGLKEIQY